MNFVFEWFSKYFEFTTKQFKHETLFVQRKIFYNIIVINLCLVMASFILMNSFLHTAQTTENQGFFIGVIFFLIFNYFLIQRGHSSHVVPLYFAFIFLSFFTYFNQVDVDDVVIVGMFSFITSLWIFISYRWWHLLLHLINTVIVIVLRINLVNQQFDLGQISTDKLMLTINAYMYLGLGVLAGSLIYYLMDRELKLSNQEAEEFKRHSLMYSELLNVLNDSEQNDVGTHLEGYFDVLTGCLNRLAYHKFFTTYAKIRYQDKKLKIVFLDLNDLKYVNDTFGHEKGDEYILSTVNSIQSKVHEHEGLYRVGGDEFILVVVEENYDQLHRSLMEAKYEIINFFQHEHFIGDFSFGIASIEEINDFDLETLEKMADERMYHMKREIKQKKANH